MKIGVFASPSISAGKYNIKDPRLDKIDSITKAKKKTYAQVELVGPDGLKEADAILTTKDSASDLILQDLEFVEARLTKATDEEEAALLHKLKIILEREEFIFAGQLIQEERQKISPYGLFTARPVVAIEIGSPDDISNVSPDVLKESGYISFFTTGERESRAWLIKKGTTAWEAAGCIHSDIQRGFIRAEIISIEDFLRSGGENPARQAGLIRLEQKEYVMQDGDLANFRFNK